MNIPRWLPMSSLHKCNIKYCKDDFKSFACLKAPCIFQRELYIYIASATIKTYHHILLLISTLNGLETLLPRVFPAYG